MIVDLTRLPQQRTEYACQAFHNGLPGINILSESDTVWYESSRPAAMRSTRIATDRATIVASGCQEFNIASESTGC
tara:strand:+ start:94976 stop:95203 length:228 start_codon:yes stop_codon:yes gene_type:complete